MRFRLALLCALISSAALGANEIRPISYAERAAVQIVANYLANGPQAVYDQLAASAPLRKLTKSDALQEIEPFADIAHQQRAALDGPGGGARPER